MSTVAAHTDRRVLFLGGEITEESAFELISGLVEMSIESDDPITLMINSVGGSADDAIAIYDAIRQSRCDVNGLVVGACWSAANLILQACHKRIMTPNSTIQIHNGSTAISRTPTSEFKSEVKQQLVTGDLFNKLIADRVGLSTSKFRRMCLTGKYFSAHEAVKHGFADAVAREHTGFNGGK